MELTKQVVSLELAKRLKDLGFAQESLFYWMEHLQTIPMQVRNIQPQKPQVITKWAAKKVLSSNKLISASAFTVAELGMMLPKLDGRGWFGTLQSPDKWVCNFYTSSSVTEHFEEADTEADARAKMLIYLKENGLL